jgi:DNA topoisomerase IB
VTEPEVLDRIRQLTVPPAWREVWICPWPNGHIQAVGTDAAGRRQYRYHDAWRARRDREKFEHALRFAEALPGLRATVAADLRRPGFGRRRVLATAVRLLDVGCFRVGGEEYAEEHETFGVATLRREHVTTHGDVARFDYPAKGSQRRVIEVADADVVAVVRALKRRRSGPEDLLAYRRDGRWVDVLSSDVNDYIKESAGFEFSAKDFRTWSATVLAAVELAQVVAPAPPSASARRRQVSRALSAVSEYLGNTPAVCRASYVDPRVIDRFHAGDRALARLVELVRHLDPADRADGRREAVERAVADLLADAPAAVGEALTRAA